MKFPPLELTLLKQRFSRKDLFRVGAPLAVLALIASVVAGRERPADPVAEPASRIHTRIEAKEADLDLSRLVRSPDALAGKPAADPFARHSFAAQAEPAAAGAAQQQPAPPQAPPLPFRYLGKMIEDGELAVFLARGEESYSIKKPATKKGQKLDDNYRVDKVTEERITFTYLPLKIQQTLEIPAVN